MSDRIDVGIGAHEAPYCRLHSGPCQDVAVLSLPLLMQDAVSWVA